MSERRRKTKNDYTEISTFMYPNMRARATDQAHVRVHTYMHVRARARARVRKTDQQYTRR